MLKKLLDSFKSYGKNPDDVLFVMDYQEEFYITWEDFILSEHVKNDSFEILNLIFVFSDVWFESESNEFSDNIWWSCKEFPKCPKTKGIIKFDDISGFKIVKEI